MRQQNGGIAKQQLDELVERVTAAVLREVDQHEGFHAVVGELRLPLRSAAALGEGVLWAPWTVAMPVDRSGDADPHAAQ